jgi:hypothetical protein
MFLRNEATILLVTNKSRHWLGPGIGKLSNRTVIYDQTPSVQGQIRAMELVA